MTRKLSAWNICIGHHMEGGKMDMEHAAKACKRGHTGKRRRSRY